MNSIRKFRKRSGFTQSYIAEKLNVGANAVSQWETGKRTPSVKHIRLLAELLRCSIDDLVKITENGVDSRE